MAATRKKAGHRQIKMGDLELSSSTASNSMDIFSLTVTNILQVTVVVPTNRPDNLSGASDQITNCVHYFLSGEN